MPFKSKSDIVAEQIHRMIRSGELEPGSVLRQRTLAERFGVSPTPVREALRRLEAEGYVVTELHRGATVVRTERARLGENFLIRGELEALAARMATPCMTAEDFAELEELNERIRTCAPRDPAITDLNRRFHFRLYESARSPILTALVSLLWRSLDGGPQPFRPLQESVSQHERILDALRRGDSESAAARTRDHIMNAYELAERHLAEGIG